MSALIKITKLRVAAVPAQDVGMPSRVNNNRSWEKQENRSQKCHHVRMNISERKTARYQGTS
jgi:hypothetical protein